MTEATQPGAEVDVDAKLEAMFGYKEPEETPEPKSDATPEGAQDEGAEGEGSDLPQETETGAEETPEGPQIELHHMAAALGVDVSLLDVTEDGEIVFKAKVDGQELTAKAADVLKSYQLEGTSNKRLMDLAEQRKAQDTQRQQFEQAVAMRLQQMDDTLNVANSLLLTEFQGVNWEYLKVHDPNTYTLKRQEFSDRRAALDQMLNAAQAERQTQQQRAFIESGQRKQQEFEKLLAAVPEWRDQAKFEQGRKDIMTGAAEFYGFAEQEVGSALDHRLLLLAKDAIAYRNLKKSQPAVANKVRIAPKTAKPGQGKPSPTGKDAQLKALRDRIKKSGGTEGVEDYLRLRGLG